MSDAASQRPTNVRWLIVAMLMAFVMLGHFNRVSISVAGAEVFMKQGLTKQQMGTVYSTFLLVYSLAMIPGGWLIDRIGSRRALAGMGLGMGFCVTLTGALGWSGLPIAGMLIPLLVIRGLAGACSVPLHPAAARSVSMWMPLSGRSTANGLITAGALIGIAFTYPGFGWLMDQLQWPLAFVVSGVTMMIFSIVWFSLSADSAVTHRWANSDEQELIGTTSRNQQVARLTGNQLAALLLNRSLVLLSLSYAAVGYFQYLFFYWMEYYFEEVLKLEVIESRRASFQVTIAMAIGMGLGGYCSDALCRLAGRRWGCRLMALIGMGLAALLAWRGIAATRPEQVVMLLSLSLGSLGLCEGIFWTTVPLLAKGRSGLACSFLNTFGNGVGLIAPVLTPWIAEEYGWMTAITVACLICGVGAILWFWIDTEQQDDR